MTINRDFFKRLGIRVGWVVGICGFYWGLFYVVMLP